MAHISPQADARDSSIVSIDMHPLAEPQVPDVLGERLGGEAHAQPVVGEEIA
jgi:hypothetical protein